MQRARKEDKPILVSIGYSACHWCHVMERESFEHSETAAFMNEHFVNIKIDREERPDLDHIYMEAVQAITGSGGWPLNVFLTPEAKPFYGGTYFPPRAIYNRPSWKDVLTAIVGSFRDKRQDIERQAQNLTEHVGKTGLFGAEGQVNTDGSFFQRETLKQIYDNLMGMADRREGGFGRAPKFPQTFSIQFLLHYYYFSKDQAALDQALLSLEKMIRGGIYDQLGGGFARYSTDDKWLAPHFEKMLYDNALLVIVLSEAYQLTRKELFRDTIVQTMDFIHRELSDGEGGFYSALDADSEGEEGRYYVWDRQEIEAVLGKEAALFNDFYGVTAEGNWEGKNILVRPRDPSEEERPRLEKACQLLLKHRWLRPRPALDDKVLLSWNALMNIACCKAYGALGIEKYREWAERNMEMIFRRLKGEGLYFFYHVYNVRKTDGSGNVVRFSERANDGSSDNGPVARSEDGQAKYPAFLDDYAGLIAALIQLQEVTGNAEYLLKAKDIMEFVLEGFSEEGTGFFFYTHKDQQDIIVRKKEIYDGATPSGNSLMAFNLAHMAIIFNRLEWGERAAGMAAALSRPVVLYPASFGIWATLYQALTYIIPEIVLTGWQPENVRKELLQELIPYRVFQSASEKNTRFPLLSDKPVEGLPLIFLCKNYACQLPVNEVTKLLRLLENVQKFGP